MKRNSRKAKSEDGSQPKISSFFKMSSSKTAMDKFTAVKCKQLSVFENGNNVQVTIQASSSHQFDRTIFVCGCSDTPLITVSCSPGMSDSMCSRTPIKSSSDVRCSSTSSSLEFCTIPETPEASYSTYRSNISKSRSFLCSTKLLVGMSGSRQKGSVKSRQSRKCVKRKSFVCKDVNVLQSNKDHIGFVDNNLNISVFEKHISSLSNVNDQAISSLSDLGHSRSVASSHVSYESSMDVSVDDDTSQCAESSSFLSPNDKSITGDLLIADCNSCASGKETVAVDTTTPVKCGSVGKVKRLVVAGSSPSAKRQTLQECISKDTTVSVAPSSCMTAKKLLAGANRFNNVKSMQCSLNQHQLGMSMIDTPLNVVQSCSQDNVLSDLLKEMHCSTNVHSKLPVLDKDPAMTHIEEIYKLDLVVQDDKGDYALDDILCELNLPTSLNASSKNYASMSGNVMNVDDNGVSSIDLGSKESLYSTEHSGVNVPDLQVEKIICSSGHIPSCNVFGSTSGTFIPACLFASENVELSTTHETAATDHRTVPTIDEFSIHPKHVDNEFGCSLCQFSPIPTPSVSDGLNGVNFAHRWGRFQVKSVTYDSQSDCVKLDLSLDGGIDIEHVVSLHGSWLETQVDVGNVVHLLSDNGGPHPCTDFDIVVSDDSGHIVVNPDLLLSGTTILSGVNCPRRSVLNEKFKGIDGLNRHMLCGSVIHSLFQQAVRSKLTDADEILALALSITTSSKFLHEMYGLSITHQDVMEEIEKYVSPLIAWMKKHVCNMTYLTQLSDLRVVGVHDIEENIWSPRLGVKGKVDMTVEVEVVNEFGQVRRNVVPLELKTGKASYSAEHKGQVTLYSLIMADRRSAPDEGLLVYLKHNEMTAVPVKSSNTRGLIQLRNEMAHYLKQQVQVKCGVDGSVSHMLSDLPAPINSMRSCSTCSHLLNCTIFQRMDGCQPHIEGHTMNSLVPEATSHLSESHVRYFSHWILCLSLESDCHGHRNLSDMWCKPSDVREKAGDCLSKMVMDKPVLGEPDPEVSIERQDHCVRFRRQAGSSGRPLNLVGLCKHETVVISSEDVCFIALYTGVIRHIDCDVVDVIVDRDSFHWNPTIMSMLFRIDRCDTFGTFGYMMSNVSHLMQRSLHCEKLRSLIVDGRIPEFNLMMSKSTIARVKNIFKYLNKPQKTSILKVLMSKDFVLIKGYPGTGKTSTIVALIKVLKELRKSVLLTSYTHSAVDNVLVKLKQDGVSFLRLGRLNCIHPLIRDHSAETLTSRLSTVEELREFYNSYSIVATSCLSMNHPLFNQRAIFDVCVVDEASQTTQPACLGPLFYADRFVLVGDPFQLPPVVKSKAARSLGMGTSLFDRLDGVGATYCLNVQYRMNRPIMQLSNELVYGSAMSCASDHFATACIQPSDIDVGAPDEWLERVLDSRLQNAVLFLDTCQLPPNRSENNIMTNSVESYLIHQMLSAYVQIGISSDDIGVISPFNAQVQLLHRQLSPCPALQGVEVNTIDRYQGRDKSVILISFVFSQSYLQTAPSAGILNDVRRLNVAITRAKHKLVMVGDSASLGQYSPFEKFFSILHSNQNVFILPSDLKIVTSE